MLPLWRHRPLGARLSQEGQDRASGGRAGRAAHVPRQEVRPHGAADVAVGVEITFQAARAVDAGSPDSVVDVQHRSHSEKNPNRDYYKCPVCSCFKWVDEWSGKSSAEEWGRDEEVKKPLSDANCFKCGAAGHWARVPIPCLLILRGDGVAGASDLNNTRVPRRTAPPTTSPKRTSPRRRSSRNASAKRAAAR